MPFLNAVGLDDRGRILGVRAGVQIALRIGGLRGHQRDMRREVDEIAAEQFQIGVDRADAYLLLAHHARQPRGLRAGEREVHLLRDAQFIKVEMLGQRQHRLQHVQFIDLRGIDARQRLRQKIGLLLVVALQAHAVTRFDHGFEQANRQIGASPPCRAATRPAPMQRAPACGCVAGVRDPRFFRWGWA